MSKMIALCGFMGCGKSTLGKRAAAALGREFLDLDAYIEQKAGKTVSEIFADHGESGFRDLEHEALKEVAARQDVLLALGGGTVLAQRNVEALRAAGAPVVLLDAPLNLLKARLKNDTKRPLLQQGDREKVIEELYGKRIALYRAAATHTFEIRDLSKEENAERLKKLLKTLDKSQVSGYDS